MTDPNLTRITAATLRGRAGGRPVVLRRGDLRGARMPGHRTRPGSIAQAHTAREFIPVADLEAGAGFFLRFLDSLNP